MLAVGGWVQEDGAGCDPALFTELAAKVEARVSTCPALATAKVPTQRGDPYILLAFSTRSLVR